LSRLRQGFDAAGPASLKTTPRQANETLRENFSMAIIKNAEQL
jgi:hypothetical protein